MDTGAMSDRDADRRRDEPHTHGRGRLGRIAVRSTVVTLLVVALVFTLLWAVLSALGTPFGLGPALLLWAGALTVAAVALSVRELWFLGGT
jgi:uncharacterized membrane protein